MKRVVDVVGASILILLTLPLLAGAAVGVLISSGRPVFFGHWRIGRNGVPFGCWKLRTMQLHAERVLHETPALRERYVTNGYKLPLAEDPRVTRFGAILRRTYLDELPQLFNVLNGTMSLVGPRPIVEEEMRNYGYRAAELLTARPGIFGAWAAEGRARPPYPERVHIELDYVRRPSLLRDVVILARSVPVVLLGQDPES